jgi:hypothetical protein
MRALDLRTAGSHRDLQDDAGLPAIDGVVIVHPKCRPPFLSGIKAASGPAVPAQATELIQ